MALTPISTPRNRGDDESPAEGVLGGSLSRRVVLPGELGVPSVIVVGLPNSFLLAMLSARASALAGGLMRRGVARVLPLDIRGVGGNL